MSQNYHVHSDRPGPTLTVRELVERLKALPDQDAVVIFKTPEHGAFGGNQTYSIDTVSVVDLPEEKINFGPQAHYDEDTGEEWMDDEDYVETKHAWKGVVIE